MDINMTPLMKRAILFAINLFVDIWVIATVYLIAEEHPYAWGIYTSMVVLTICTFMYMVSTLE